MIFLNNKDIEYYFPSIILQLFKYKIHDPYQTFHKEKKIIFIHIPKTAGRTISNRIFGKNSGHFSIKRYYYFNKKLFNKSFKFTFVRNPWSRLFSAFDSLYECRYERNPFGEFVRNNISCYENFDEFLLSMIKNKLDASKVLSWTHFIPQYKWLSFYTFINNSSPIEIDFIGKYENLENDYKKLCLQLEIDTNNSNIGYRNINKDYRNFYTVKTKKFVEELYQKDIKFFDYDFED